MSFLGFFATGSAQQGDRTQTRRQIEFIGDSYTVGYGNTSPTRSCTPEQVWLTTDNSKAFGPLTANAYGADYQVNAISGRGVVRNYNGGTKDTLVQMYPFVLFDKKERYSDPSWRPQVVVVGLGTNDFSTELHPGEQWSSREQLHAEYEATYVRFLQQLRQQQPQAYLLLWATDGEHGELQAEEARVVEQLRASGDRRIGLVMTSGLQMSGCDGHPSAADDKEISARLREAIDGVPDIWNGTGK